MQLKVAIAKSPNFFISVDRNFDKFIGLSIKTAMRALKDIVITI